MARGDGGIGLGSILAIGAGIVGGVWLVERSRRAPSGAASPGSSSLEIPDRRDARSAGTVAADRARGSVSAAVELPPGRWVWPLPSWQGRAPVISDGWGSPRDGGVRRHKGADLMYRRKFLDEHTLVFPAAPPHSKWHFLPPFTVALAAADGTLWSAGKTSRGYTVVISHGRPWATYYTHLVSLLVPETARGAGGHKIKAGQPLGFVGVDPTNPKIAHLHFEIWKGGTHDAAIDPAPILAALPVIDLATVTPGKAVA